MRRRFVFFLSMFLPLCLFAQGNQARQPNVMVVPFVEPGEGENDRIKDAVLNDEAVPFLPWDDFFYLMRQIYLFCGTDLLPIGSLIRSRLISNKTRLPRTVR